jgi:hypothetical protein
MHWYTFTVVECDVPWNLPRHPTTLGEKVSATAPCGCAFVVSLGGQPAPGNRKDSRSVAGFGCNKPRVLNIYDAPMPCATVPAMRRARGARQIVAAL